MTITELYESNSIKLVSRNNVYQTYLMNLAIMASEQSSCSRHKVGAVLSSLDKTIISTGFNGVKSGENHCADIDAALALVLPTKAAWHASGSHRKWSISNERHAEFNMFMFANALFDLKHIELEFSDNSCIECKPFETYVNNITNEFNILPDDYFSSVYITHFPCPACTKLIKMYRTQYSINTVYFKKMWYNNVEDIQKTIDIFKSVGIQLIQLI